MAPPATSNLCQNSGEDARSILRHIFRSMTYPGALLPNNSETNGIIAALKEVSGGSGIEEGG